ncbi:MAG: hypothetical protein JNL65_00850, partial [Saprospiraceae bacterium]|nr:hypothetical protein [Saprospiraceae bacterium]
MKNRIQKICFYLLNLFFILPFSELKATEFSSSDWDVSYNTCGGYMEVNILYYNKDGINDWMEWMYLYYKKSNGDFEQVLAWANDDNYNIDGHCCSDVTDGTPFIYHINSPTTWTYFYVEFSNDDLVKMRIRIYNLPADLIGTNVTMRINGFWHGGGGDNDVSISNWEKNASTTSINAPTGLTASVDTYCERVHLAWNNPASNPCSSGDWQVYVYRNNTYIGTGGKNGYYDDYSAVKGVTYNYKVRALFEPNSYIDNYSGYTDPPVDGRVLGPLAPPTNVSASTDRCDGKILVQWQWPGQNPVNFLIERSTSAGSGFSLLSNTIDPGARSYLDENSISPNQNYYYRLKAKNSCGDWSDTYSGTISPPGNAAGIPTEPTNVTATPDTNKIKV